MTELFRRAYEVQIGTVIIDSLDLRFKVTRTLRGKPNTCELTIYNLTERSRGALAESKKSVIQIKAGYRGTDPTAPSEPGIVFRGDVREVYSTLDHPDWVTHVEGGDGERAIRTARVNRSFKAGTPLQKVMKQLAGDLKVDLGNSAKRALESASLEQAGREFLHGVTVSGNAHRELAVLAKSAGLELSIQNGAIQLLERGLPLKDVSIVLTPDAGLIGSPTLGDKGIVKFRSLMNPDIVPGRQIEIESRALEGRFRAVRCDYQGDTTAQDWYVDVEAKAL